MFRAVNICSFSEQTSELFLSFKDHFNYHNDETRYEWKF